MIGQSVNRIDGPLKVTGQARYSYERRDAGLAATGFIVGATIATGQIVRIDTSRAERAPGVLLVLTHLNVPPQGGRDGSLPDQFGRPWPVLIGDRVEHFGQPAAFVVASTFEQARDAGAMVVVTYERETGTYELAGHPERAYSPRRRCSRRSLRARSVDR